MMTARRGARLARRLPFFGSKPREWRGVDELRHATGGCTATVYEFAGGSVAHFAPDAPDFAEAGELKSDDLAPAQRILDERGMAGGNAA